MLVPGQHHRTVQSMQSRTPQWIIDQQRERYEADPMPDELRGPSLSRSYLDDIAVDGSLVTVPGDRAGVRCRLQLCDGSCCGRIAS